MPDTAGKPGRGQPPKPPAPSPSSPPFDIAGAIAEAVGCCANMASYEDGVGVGKLVHCAL